MQCVILDIPLVLFKDRVVIQEVPNFVEDVGLGREDL